MRRTTRWTVGGLLVVAGLAAGWRLAEPSGRERGEETLPAPVAAVPTPVARTGPLEAPSAWLEAVPPERIVGPIHYVGTAELATYLIVTPEGSILLDGGMPAGADRIVASIRALRETPERIRFLLFTQAHVDHVGTLAHFRKRTNALVVAMAPDDELIASGGKLDYLYGATPSHHFEPVPVDRVIRDGDTVTLGEVTLTAHHTPGHTRGCTTWTTTVTEDGRAFRVTFAGSLFVNPGTRLVHEPSYPGILDDYRRAIEVEAGLVPDIFLAAHASAFEFATKRARRASGGAAAFVDPDGYRRMLRTQRSLLESAVAKERE